MVAKLLLLFYIFAGGVLATDPECIWTAKIRIEFQSMPQTGDSICKEYYPRTYPKGRLIEYYMKYQCSDNKGNLQVFEIKKTKYKFLSSQHWCLQNYPSYVYKSLVLEFNMKFECCNKQKVKLKLSSTFAYKPNNFFFPLFYRLSLFCS